ncbi:raftlin-2 isoform X2 [Ictidomys tridecemlineatus]|uniref:Raftlin family member 2 n=1 Tax=Ictidomys tridecemlineatus TaxID=43179 RepID=I3MPR8_ICTTR|nr:raftlin-2 [Ictidomys tridecemlineatus]XP_040150583.1 raftlin-2 [Ictidomys tridecemlineatus]KAG3274925.1 raftlin family member 2, transcript variant X1 [Ictidomys tridecemlineatus]KAG3274926.1 raftlin family member 2, transcript variant X2 [Ictidomys tridecemlineatus]
MGCGLRKLEDPDDSSPGKIFSTLKRPQVETKTEFAYEYVLLDFTLQASPNPEVIKINSILDIVTKVEDYYLKGYVVGAIHPAIQSVGQRKHLPASYLYRVVLLRLKLSPKHSAAPRVQRHPRLVIEECPLTYETQTNDIAKELIEKINVAAKKGMKFVGFISQHYPPPKYCNGTNYDGDIESMLHVRHSSDENCKSWNEGTLSGQSSESGIEEELHHESGQYQMEQNDSPSSSKLRKGEDNKLYIVFNVFDDDSTCWTYQEGVLSMKVTRKGSIISTLDADWLQLTTFYYKQGLSLMDSFVCWETPKGDHLPKSLEGFFIYEEEGSGIPGSNRKGNDAIVVEQWTVIEGCEIKTDYGPLLHTLAEFGWLLTSVLPTPILRHDSEGNLATKQVVFLQRPVMWNSAVQTPERKASPFMKGDDRNKVSSRSIGLDAGGSQPMEARAPPEEGRFSPSGECWTKEGRPAQCSGFSGFSSSDSVLRELDEGQFDQEDGVTQVTCM